MTKIPDHAYTTEEIRLEANRLRRRHYRRSLALAVASAAFATWMATGAFMLLADPATLREPIHRAAQSVPLSGGFMYHLTIAEMALGSLCFSFLATRKLRNRIPERGQYVMAALERLTERGGL